jgi:DNA uptake protein ComE-like DNA-binding protein
MRLTVGLLLMIGLTLAACARRNDIARNTNRPSTGQATVKETVRPEPTTACVNLNTATVEQLRPLPGIGEVMCRKIIAHRERHGPFRRPAGVITIAGFSEQKYRRIEKLVCVN